MDASEFALVKTYLTRNAVAIVNKRIGIPLTHIKFIKEHMNDSSVALLIVGFDTSITIGNAIATFIQDIKNKSECEIAIPENIEMYANDIAFTIGYYASPSLFQKLYNIPSITSIIIDNLLRFISSMLTSGNALLMEHVSQFAWFKQGIYMDNRNELLALHWMFLDAVKLLVRFFYLTEAEMKYILHRAEILFVTDVALYMYDYISEEQGLSWSQTLRYTS